MNWNVKLLKIVFASVAIALLALVAFRAFQPSERNAGNEQQAVELPEELMKGPPSKANRPYLTGAFRRHFKKHRATLDKIVVMTKEERMGIDVGFGRHSDSLKLERWNNYLALLRELGSSEWISVKPYPFEVEVVMYSQGLSVTGMMRGYLYSPDKDPYPPVFVDDLDVGMKEHPEGWHIVYVSLGDGWYIFCNWEK